VNLRKVGNYFKSSYVHGKLLNYRLELFILSSPTFFILYIFCIFVRLSQLLNNTVISSSQITLSDSS
jgi:hypothetical protein